MNVLLPGFVIEDFRLCDDAKGFFFQETQLLCHKHY
jgi:hypothetical protein